MGQHEIDRQALPYYVTYEAGFEESGKLLGVKMDLYGAHGTQKNDSPYSEIKGWLDNGKTENKIE